MQVIDAAEFNHVYQLADAWRALTKLYNRYGPPIL